LCFREEADNSTEFDSVVESSGNISGDSAQLDNHHVHQSSSSASNTLETSNQEDEVTPEEPSVEVDACSKN